MSKEHITIVGDGSTQADVEARVKQIKNLVAEVRGIDCSLGCKARIPTFWLATCDRNHMRAAASPVQTDAEYEKEKLNERIARLSGGVAVIQVCEARTKPAQALCGTATL